MPFQPFLVTVARTQEISPHFRRITFTGASEIGPAVPVRDQRIKLIIPGTAGLSQLVGEDWFSTWRSLDPASRGFMRTYSIRDLRRQADEIDIDFVLHPGSPGPASSWAETAKIGDQLLIIAPDRDDDTGAGIEFAPGRARQVFLFGDETAVPAIARIIADWPAGLYGTAFAEVPDAADIQEFDCPDTLTLNWLVRPAGINHGELLNQAVAELVHAPATPVLLTTDAAPVWETPVYSSAGEEITEEAVAEDTYYWIAGECSAVTTMRRLLVKEAGIPRGNVSFMGYWKRGRCLDD
ncbi:siderophore-interacting protein [Corynebacterium kutscheri]|uniref:Siderophore-interacting protein n=1 Tax=Corynebacterium kutscheri TaxID=35755 RepID=A0A0F6QYY3_9CORY|nr:siderophore-interacting protein [Corynebacterium kutscheri]AKE40395.1 siderophore-interacting protein [Corynebacterium kutscheri]VEH05288.1 vibriobactin utilization protein viuB [Corynebacterium kutscheri]VEH10790.1 vibriobactin utilization protein viuB [Corynebacterium kutscheri]